MISDGEASGSSGWEASGWDARELPGRGRVEIAVSGELDLAAAEDFERALRASLASADTELALDLGAVTFLDSSALAVLLRVASEAEARGRRLRLAAASPVVRRVIEIAAVDGLMAPGDDPA